MFKKINPPLFAKLYLDLFNYEEIAYGKNIITEDTIDDNHYVYFIITGKIEIFTKKCIKDLFILSNNIEQKYID